MMMRTCVYEHMHVRLHVPAVYPRTRRCFCVLWSLRIREQPPAVVFSLSSWESRCIKHASLVLLCVCDFTKPVMTKAVLGVTRRLEREGGGEEGEGGRGIRSVK